MLKKKLLLSLIIFQGILIVIAIIAIIIGVFFKGNTKSKLSSNNLSGINIENIYLFDDNNLQQKIIEDDQVIIQIIDINTKKIKKEIIFEK